MTSKDLPSPASGPTLSTVDEQAIDALIENSFDVETAARTADARRVEAAAALMGLLRDYPVEDPDESLAFATLTRIDRVEEERAARLLFEARQETGVAGQRGARRIRLPDFISIAAVLLIAVSVLFPLLTTMRNHRIDAGCANNMRQVGYGFANYAADYRGSLPIATAGLGGSWDTVRNIINLDPLVQGQYCEHHHLNCPGHHDGVERSYSYRWVTPGMNQQWGAPRVTVVLGDLNPVMDAARSGRVVPPLSMSINHGGRGQWVLTSDGATLWLDEPLIGGGDNIWLPDSAVRLVPGLRPDQPWDVFLAH